MSSVGVACAAPWSRGGFALPRARASGAELATIIAARFGGTRCFKSNFHRRNTAVVSGLEMMANAVIADRRAYIC